MTSRHAQLRRRRPPGGPRAGARPDDGEAVVHSRPRGRARRRSDPGRRGRRRDAHRPARRTTAPALRAPPSSRSRSARRWRCGAARRAGAACAAARRARPPPPTTCSGAGRRRRSRWWRGSAAPYPTAPGSRSRRCSRRRVTRGSPRTTRQRRRSRCETRHPTSRGSRRTLDVLWPPDHHMASVRLPYAAADACGPVSCAVAVTSNEPETGTGPADLAPDWQVLDDHHVRLRRERAESGSGRVYTVAVTCSDVAGGATTARVEVHAPLRDPRPPNSSPSSHRRSHPIRCRRPRRRVS